MKIQSSICSVFILYLHTPFCNERKLYNIGRLFKTRENNLCKNKTRFQADDLFKYIPSIYLYISIYTDTQIAGTFKGCN